jgi:hypothetical protein
MVGFGFMDNFIMITAGSAIDNTLGVQMGLATMTAAAIGQVVSDVSGVVFGDTVAKVFKVAPSNLTKAQSKLAVVGRIKLGGAVLGVIAGCTLGAVALWLIPDRDETAANSQIPTAQSLSNSNTSTTTITHNASSSEQHYQQQERIREQLHRLQMVMTDIMTAQDDTWHDRRASCTLYVNESMEQCLPTATTKQSPVSFFDFPNSSNSSSSSSHEEPATIQALGSAINDPEVVHTLKEGRVVVFANTIYVPVKGNDDDDKKSILGIFKIKLNNGSFYTGTEIKDAKKVARNLGFFLNRMV